jgi:cytosine/adenosine deaminase-related metal-dependent hydrolase
MFAAMRTTLAMQRALDNDMVISSGNRPERLALSARDVLGFATIDGARTLGLGDRIGSITPGKEADLVILRADRLNMVPVDNNPIAAVTLAANSSNVDSVMVAGRFVKRHGELVGTDLVELRRRVTESRDRLVAATPGASIGGGWQPSSTW